MEGGYNLDRQGRHFEGEPDPRVPLVGTPAASGFQQSRMGYTLKNNDSPKLP